MPPTTGRPKLHRRKAFRRAAEDTRTQVQDEAIAETPSAGDAPRAPATLDPTPPLTTKVATEHRSPIHSPCCHKTRSCFSIHKRRSRRTHLATSPMSRRRTPVQRNHPGLPSSTASPMAPEWSTTGAKTSPGGLIPLQRRRRHRLAADARTRHPRSTRTSKTYIDQQEASDPRYLATALRPSEAERTAVSAGGDEIASPFLFQL
ncbi:unnamed protein product [Urochloa humidicola]